MVTSLKISSSQEKVKTNAKIISIDLGKNLEVKKIIRSMHFTKIKKLTDRNMILFCKVNNNYRLETYKIL